MEDNDEPLSAWKRTNNVTGESVDKKRVYCKRCHKEMPMLEEYRWVCSCGISVDASSTGPTIVINEFNPNENS